MAVDVRDDPDRNRFEVRSDGAVAGFAQYVRRPSRVIFVHTEIDPAFEEQGLGSVLVSAALDAVRGGGDRVVPLCPFVAGYIERHPEYDDLVDHALMAVLSTSE